MKNILISGITGSGGSYLADYILENHNVGVWGICRWHSTGTMVNIQHIRDRITIRECDLLDISSIIRTLQECKPYRIFHLAAYANVKKCFDTPLAVINNNIMGTANLLEAVRLICPGTVVQMCSTSEVYGTPLTTPIDENHPMKPVNPYAVSKLAGEALAYAYFKSWGLNVIITRMFAYINPRRQDLFASAFAKQIVRIEEGKQKVLLHGNLESTRTIIDVRDAMRAYWLACDKCEYGTPYNIGGREVISVRDVLSLLKFNAKVKIRSKQDKGLLRPVDITNQIPNTSKFDTLTGWKPKYCLNESIKFLLNHYRKEQNECPSHISKVFRTIRR